MKIGVVGTLWLNTPPAQYGGTEVVVYNLVNGLSNLGHDVTFFGPATAKVHAKLVGTTEKPLRDMGVDWKNTSYTLLHMTEVFDMADRFDILHVHLNKSQDYFSLPLSLYSNTPVLFTIHFKLPDQTQQTGRHKVLTKYQKLPFTSISNSQRDGIPLNFITTVYNSLQLSDYTFNSTPQDYFVWLGKINPVKGTKEAILAAKKAGVKLIAMGAIDEGVPAYMDYYKNEVLPLVDNSQIVLKTNVNLEEKAKILAGAKALLNPILWEEPFGLVMAEAQATGTPVIAFKRGAAPEVVIDGKTGFVVNTLNEMVEKIKEVTTINRQACRTHIETMFTIEKMVNGYYNAYETTIKNWKEYKQNQLDFIKQQYINVSNY